MKTTLSYFSVANFFALLLVCSFTGCTGNGGEALPDLGEVTGIVTLDGTPLYKAKVIFEPENIDDKGRSRSSAGTTAEDGKFVLQFNSDVAGAAVGNHKVIISKMSDNPEEAGLQLVPKQYNENSELTADVTAGKNTINFDLKSK